MENVFNSNEIDIYSKMGIDLQSFASKEDFNIYMYEIFKDSNHIDFNTSLQLETDEKSIYKYIPISKLDIVVCEASKEDKLKEKFEKSTSILEYLTLNIQDVQNSPLKEYIQDKKVNTKLETDIYVPKLEDILDKWNVKDSEQEQIDTEFTNFMETISPQVDIKEDLNKKKVVIPSSDFKYLQGNTLKQKDLEYMLGLVRFDQVEQLDEQTQKFLKKIPYIVTYQKSVFWNIYYSNQSKRYIAMFFKDDNSFASIAYAIYLKILQYATKKEQYIYAPILETRYLDEFLPLKDKEKLEEDLFYFTKNWPLIYQVYDKKENYTMQIVGKMFVYGNLETTYKLVFKNKEQANIFTKNVAILATLAKQCKDTISLKPLMKNDFSLTLYDDDFELDLQNSMSIVEYLDLKYQKLYTMLLETVNMVSGNIMVYDALNTICLAKEKRLDIAQKQIQKFYAASKNIFKTIGYFFTQNPEKEIEQKEKETLEIIRAYKDFDTLDIVKEKLLEIFANDEKYKKMQVKISNETMQKLNALESAFSKKDQIYTIQDYIALYNEYAKIRQKDEETKQNIKALDEKIYILDSNISSTKSLLDQIKQSKKHFFGFVKYALKGESIPQLNPGQKQEEEKQLSKTFIYNIDFYAVASKMDQYYRDNCSKKQIDSVYLIIAGLLDQINIIKEYQDQIPDSDIVYLENKLKDLRIKYEKLLNEDILNVLDSSTKQTQIRYIDNKSFSESKKDIISVLKINNKTNISEYIQILKRQIQDIEEIILKSSIPMDMQVYKIGNWNSKIQENVFSVYNIDIQSELINIQEDPNYNLFVLNLSQDQKGVFLTNIFFFDNDNKTLPIGQNLSTQMLLDMSLFKFRKKANKKAKIAILSEDSYTATIKNLNVFEYKVYDKKEFDISEVKESTKKRFEE